MAVAGNAPVVLDVRFGCTCGATYQVSTRMRGRALRCKRCGELVQVPRLRQRLPRPPGKQETTIVSRCNLCHEALPPGKEGPVCTDCEAAFRKIANQRAPVGYRPRRVAPRKHPVQIPERLGLVLLLLTGFTGLSFAVFGLPLVHAAGVGTTVAVLGGLGHR